MQKRLLWIASVIWLILFGQMASSGAAAAELTVSAAMSLKNAFEEIAMKYESANKGIKIVFNFGASGDLARQIEGGAPVDVFASASIKDADDLDARGLLVSRSRADFAKNAVVLVSPKPAPVRMTGFADLTSDKVRRVAIGNPKTVPAGRYAAELLDYYGITQKIQGKLIYAENVRQVLDYVARGEVDAGIVYSTDALVRSKDVMVVAVAPEASHKPVLYPIAIVKGTENEAAAKGLISFILSPEGRRILEKYGFKGDK
ncbi:MAG: molybdate ABC transporter substrate-binding protein [Dissulfurispiraceae bacterium]